MALRLSNILVILSLLLLVLSGSVVFGQEGSPLHVVASFSILADVVSNVSGDAALVTSLIPVDTDPHGFTPTPRDLVVLAEADVIFVVGANFEEGLLKSIDTAAETVHIVAASNCVDILPFGGSQAEETAVHDSADSDIAALCAAHHSELDARRDDNAHYYADTLGMLYSLPCGGHGVDKSSSAAHHEAGICDPHVWTDPYNVMLWTLMIRDILSQHDPAHADIYAAHAAAYITELESLTHDELLPMVESLPVADRILVTNHGAYNYFAQAFDFTIVGLVIPGSSTLAESSAAEAATLIDTIRASGVKAIFAETTSNPNLAQQIAEETGVQFVTLYTGSLSDPSGPAATYADYMRYNTQAIVEALGAAE